MTPPSPHPQPGLKPKGTKSMIPTLMQIKREKSLGQRSHTQMPMCVLSCFSRVQFFATLWTVTRQAPLSWDSPGKNTGVGYHALLQGIFPTLRSSRHLHLLCLLNYDRFLTTEPLEKSPRCYRDHVVTSKSSVLSTGPSSYATLMNCYQRFWIYVKNKKYGFLFKFLL